MAARFAAEHQTAALRPGDARRCDPDPRARGFRAPAERATLLALLQVSVFARRYLPRPESQVLETGTRGVDTGRRRRARRRRRRRRRRIMRMRRRRRRRRKRRMRRRRVRRRRRRMRKRRRRILETRTRGVDTGRRRTRRRGRRGWVGRNLHGARADGSGGKKWRRNPSMTN
jgi:hypothetical protein